ATNLDDPANAALAPKGTPLWSATHNNFAPRLGIAYQLKSTSGHELVVRGGVGLFYDLGNNTAATGVNFFPHSRTTFIFMPQFPMSRADATPPALTLDPPYDVKAFDPHLKLPRSYQWNVSLEQSLGTNQSVSATYLGSAGRKLLRDELIVPETGLNPNFN